MTNSTGIHCILSTCIINIYQQWWLIHHNHLDVTRHLGEFGWVGGFKNLPRFIYDLNNSIRTYKPIVRLTQDTTVLRPTLNHIGFYCRLLGRFPYTNPSRSNEPLPFPFVCPYLVLYILPPRTLLDFLTSGPSPKLSPLRLTPCEFLSLNLLGSPPILGLQIPLGISLHSLYTRPPWPSHYV